MTEIHRTFPFLAATVLLIWPVSFADAHCDTMNGPVIADAKLALENNEVTPVLKWVEKKREQEITAAFNTAQAQRSLGEPAAEKARMEFFETLVRVHREGEGETFTGIKTSEEVDPIIALADKSMEINSSKKLRRLMAQNARNGIRHRFAKVMEKKEHMSESVDTGREYVAAYVDYIHYVERLHQAISGGKEHH